MKEYYYLSAQREPQGPHSLSELADMMASGRVNPTTLVACKGGSSWEPLGSVLSREHGEAGDIPPLPRGAGQCPSCKRELSGDLTEGQLPRQCPGCGRKLQPNKAGIWANFCYAIRNYAKFSGRATRAEYWSFVLVNFIICILLYSSIIGAGIMSALKLMEQGVQLLPDNHIPLEEQDITPLLEQLMNATSYFLPILIIGVATIIAWSLFILIPAYSVLTRRLHDIGWSGWWVVLQLFINFVLPVLLMFVPLAVMLGGTTEQAAENCAMSAYDTVLMYVNLASYALSLLLFILTLLDSQQGANKYGPSSKYPLG